MSCWAAGIVLFAPSGRVLFCRRRDDRTWATPGGCIEPGEQPSHAALRELAEETGYHGPVHELELLPQGLPHGFWLYSGVVDREFRPLLNEEHFASVWADPRRPPRPLHRWLPLVFPG